MTYRVTQQDIDAGLKVSMRFCPVARTIKRRHPVAIVRVASHQVAIGDKRYRLPIRVTRWIGKYDAGEEVRPIRFEL